MCTFPGLRLKPLPTGEMEAYREYTALGDLNGDFENLPPRGKLLRYFGKIAQVLWEIAQVLWENKLSLPLTVLVLAISLFILYKLT